MPKILEYSSIIILIYKAYHHEKKKSNIARSVSKSILFKKKDLIVYWEREEIKV